MTIPAWEYEERVKELKVDSGVAPMTGSNGENGMPGHRCLEENLAKKADSGKAHPHAGYRIVRELNSESFQCFHKAASVLSVDAQPS